MKTVIVSEKTAKNVIRTIDKTMSKHKGYRTRDLGHGMVELTTYDK